MWDAEKLKIYIPMSTEKGKNSMYVRIKYFAPPQSHSGYDKMLLCEWTGQRTQAWHLNSQDNGEFWYEADRVHPCYWLSIKMLDSWVHMSILHRQCLHRFSWAGSRGICFSSAPTVSKWLEDFVSFPPDFPPDAVFLCSLSLWPLPVLKLGNDYKRVLKLLQKNPQKEEQS